MKFYLTPHPTFFPVCGCPDKSLCGPGTRLFMKALVASGYKPDDSETTVVSDVELDDADFQ